MLTTAVGFPASQSPSWHHTRAQPATQHYGDSFTTQPDQPCQSRKFWSAKLLRKLWADFDKILCSDGTWPAKVVRGFRWRSVGCGFWIIISWLIDRLVDCFVSSLLGWLVGAGEEMDQKQQFEEQLRAYQDKKRYKKRQIRELQEDLQVTWRSFTALAAFAADGALVWKCRGFGSCQRKLNCRKIAGGWILWLLESVQNYCQSYGVWKCVGGWIHPVVQTLGKSTKIRKYPNVLWGHPPRAVQL